MSGRTPSFPRALAAATLLLGLALSPCRVLAQPTVGSPTAAPFELRGTTLAGSPVNLAALRGKVVMVFYWSTACAVCLQKMPELRANAAGWRGKPFELVLVSTDRKRGDAETYAATVRQTEPGAPAFPMLWRGDAGFSDSMGAVPARLPVTLVLDAKGRVVARHDGRMAPEAWDDVAELLP
jgi:thiol-disulfide isomerase/thioredoxin